MVKLQTFCFPPCTKPNPPSLPACSVKHVSAVLKLKTNLSKKDRNRIKDTLSESQGEGTAVDSPPFFSKVQVK